MYGICADGSVVDIPPSFCNLEIGTCKRAPDVPNTKWYCIVVAGWNSYIRTLNKLVGSMSSKLRHLHLLGYKPVIVSYCSSWSLYSTDKICLQLNVWCIIFMYFQVPWFEWKELSVEEQERYLAKKIWEEFKEEMSCTVR